jgi:hypothetical protein
LAKGRRAIGVIGFLGVSIGATVFVRPASSTAAKASVMSVIQERSQLLAAGGDSFILWSQLAKIPLTTPQFEMTIAYFSQTGEPLGTLTFEAMRQDTLSIGASFDCGGPAPYRHSGYITAKIVSLKPTSFVDVSRLPRFTTTVALPDDGDTGLQFYSDVAVRSTVKGPLVALVQVNDSLYGGVRAVVGVPIRANERRGSVRVAGRWNRALLSADTYVHSLRTTCPIEASSKSAGWARSGNTP